MKRYIFLWEQVPIGQLQFDDTKGNFTYFVTDLTIEEAKTKGIAPTTLIELLEEIKRDALEIESEEAYYEYMKYWVNDFHFMELKGYD